MPDHRAVDDSAVLMLCQQLWINDTTVCALFCREPKPPERIGLGTLNIKARSGLGGILRWCPDLHPKPPQPLNCEPPTKTAPPPPPHSPLPLLNKNSPPPHAKETLQVYHKDCNIFLEHDEATKLFPEPWPTAASVLCVGYKVIIIIRSVVQC